MLIRGVQALAARRAHGTYRTWRSMNCGGPDEPTTTADPTRANQGLTGHGQCTHWKACLQQLDPLQGQLPLNGSGAIKEHVPQIVHLSRPLRHVGKLRVVNEADLSPLLRYKAAFAHKVGVSSAERVCRQLPRSGEGLCGDNRFVAAHGKSRAGERRIQRVWSIDTYVRIARPSSDSSICLCILRKASSPVVSATVATRSPRSGRNRAPTAAPKPTTHLCAGPRATW
eukprot:scaffold1588_cov408-Prasinococcus_capsulatus_cf.AAC.9